ncbi:hypothetical protein XM25_00805 [Devosia sp. H5989]|nr:hypothetical protein XM25_00805 [Devosia sp. H5989]
MKIEVDVPFEAVNGNRAGTYLSHALSAIGFVRSDLPLHVPAPSVLTGSGSTQAVEGTGTSEVSHSSQADAATAAPQRERGKPAQGRARRTKEEIAEDEAAEAADAAVKAAGEETGAVVADRQISSSPEDRVDPDNDADAAQDAADEAAETAQQKAASGKAQTLDDVRAALGKYVKAYGMAAAQEDGPKVIALVLGKKHSPEAPCKISDIPDDKIAAAIAGVEEMIQKNPYNRAADL